jgi:WD40 repeat protein
LERQASATARGERRASMSSDGARVAVSNQIGNAIYLFNFAEPSLWRSIQAFPGLQGATLSPDGRWVIAASWPNANTKIWNAVTHELEKTFTPAESLTSQFSPDGRTLAVGNRRGGEILEVGTWKSLGKIAPDRTGPGIYMMSYSSDGRLLALVRDLNVVQMLDASTLQEVARLEAPDLQGVAPMAFSPDGGTLATGSTTHIVQTWDLRAIRKRLEELGLDWDHPPIAKAPPERKPLSVTVGE